MDQSVIVAITLISMIGTVIGAALGVAASAKLTQFRLKKLSGLRENQRDQMTQNVIITQKRFIEIERRIKALEYESEKIRDIIDTKYKRLIRIRRNGKKTRK